jgi:Fe-S-cluster containining protein
VEGGSEALSMNNQRKYKCDECGACCSGGLIVEIDHLDVVREPKLLTAAKLMDGNGKIQYESEWQKQYLLACGDACKLLGTDNRCTIYPQRPNVCVMFEAGTYQCQTARQSKGLPFLADVEGRVPTAEEIVDLEDEE